MKDIQKEITPIAADDLFIVLNHPNAKFDYRYTIIRTMKSIWLWTPTEAASLEIR